MRKSALMVMTLFFTMTLLAQVAPDKYFIEFTDKNNSPYSIDRPGEFLSDRAIQRRQNQWIGIEENDLPVNPSYVEAIKNINVTILTRSKWLNGITIHTNNIALVDSIGRLPFVKSIVKNKIMPINSGTVPHNKFHVEENFKQYISPGVSWEKQSNEVSYNYGPSYAQIHMLKGEELHQLGYRGQGKVIAILDAGFFMANTLPVFDSLRANNQILGTKDFVDPGNDVYLESPHGMEVLSVIGGNFPGQLIGTAPKAGFWLLRPEDTGSEYLIEEYNWVSAAEFADSVGADIINSSLGYTRFDNHEQDHTCADMSGDKTPVTRGANIASTKGLLVINSAGNSGGSDWQCVGAPADGFSVLAIAAVDSMGIRASFSSVGEATNRVKPNVAAMGAGTILAGSNGNFFTGSGTSFSAPLIAGMAACLWQTKSWASNYYILRSIERSANQFLQPDSFLGFGIPDFKKAMNLVVLPEAEKFNRLQVYPNPFTNQVKIMLFAAIKQIVIIKLYDLQGRIVYSKENIECPVGEKRIDVFLPDELPTGCYCLHLISTEVFRTSLLVKIK